MAFGAKAAFAAVDEATSPEHVYERSIIGLKRACD